MSTVEEKGTENHTLAPFVIATLPWPVLARPKSDFFDSEGKPTDSVERQTQLLLSKRKPAQKCQKKLPSIISPTKTVEKGWKKTLKMIGCQYGIERKIHTGANWSKDLVGLNHNEVNYL